MPFNYNQNNLQYMPVSSETLKQASISPMEVAGKAMLDLHDDISDRIYARNLKGAKTIEDTMALGQPRTERGMLMQNQRMNALKALQTQQLQNRQMQSMDITDANVQSTIDTNRFNLGMKTDALEALRRDRMIRTGEGVPETQFGLPSLQIGGKAIPTTETTPFNALTPEDKFFHQKVLGVEPKEFSPYGMQGDRTYMQLRDNLIETATNEGWDEDRLRNEMNNLNKTYQTSKTAGVSFVAGNKMTQFVKQASDIGKDITVGNNYKKYSKGDRDVAQANYKRTDSYTTKQEAEEQKFRDTDNTIRSVKLLYNDLDSAIKSGAFKTGMFDSTVQKLGELSPTELTEILGGSTEDIATQLNLSGDIGMVVAERLRDMSGLAATEPEFARTLSQIIGGDWTQEKYKLSQVQNFANQLERRNKIAGKRLVEGGLVGDVADIYQQYNVEKKPTAKKEVTSFIEVGGTKYKSKVEGGRTMIQNPSNGKWYYSK